MAAIIKKKLKNGILIISIIGIFLSCSPHIQKPEKLESYTKYIQENYITPEDYVISKFNDHRIVILGEYHRIKHDVLLVQNLIPKLYEAGVYNIAMEFALYDDQKLIDELITSKEYNEKLAQRIHLNSCLISGGLGLYHEYCDIFKIVWQLNNSLPQTAKKMRIIGINDTLNWSYIKSKADRNNNELRKKVFKDSSERNWADRVKSEVINRGEKVLCYCGIHHAFSKYAQPYVNENGQFIGSTRNRFGNHLFKYFKKEVFTIALHCPWPPLEGYKGNYILPADGVIDYILAEFPEDKQRFGFDTVGSPIGALELKTSLYKYGYKNFTLKDFCDGYICQGKFTTYEGVTPIKNFINSDTIKEIHKKTGYPLNKMPLKEITYAFATDADIQTRWRREGILKKAKIIYKIKSF